MTKKILIAAIIAIILAAIGGYVLFRYNRAQSALSRARVTLRSVGTALHRDDNLDRARERFTLARIEVEELERSHATWVGSQELSEVRKELAAYKQEIKKRIGESDG